MSARKRILKRAGVVGGIVLLATAVTLAIRGILASAPARKPAIQQVSLLKPPPPPPPEEKPPPEPEMKQEEVKLPEPEQTPQQAQDDQPAGQELGVDAEGGAGSDGFGLIGRKGGRDLLAGGGPFAGYAGLIQRQLQDAFSKNKKLRELDYKAVIKIWLDSNGRVERFELVGSTGDPSTDEKIRVALAAVTALPEPPPEGMPQPVKLRVVSRGAI